MSSAPTTTIPNDFLDPICYQPMISPVRVNCSNNHYFQSDTVKLWRRLHNTCPLDGEPILEITPDKQLQTEICTFIENHPNLFWNKASQRGKTIAEINLEIAQPTEPPHELQCPILYRTMTDPVSINCPSNHRFQRGAIQQALKEKKKCPLDRNDISQINPDQALRTRAHVFMQIHPELYSGKTIAEQEREIAKDLKAVQKASESATEPSRILFWIFHGSRR